MELAVNVTITGFEAFYLTDPNPSEQIVHCLKEHAPLKNGLRLHTRVFPVKYAGAETRVASVLEKTCPQILILTGVDKSAQRMKLERVARNLDDSTTPDNDGVVLQSTPIARDNATDIYESDLDLTLIAERLRHRNLDSEVSDDAGGFICNHYYYIARRMIERRNFATNCLFVHVPMIADVEEVTRVAQGLLLLVDYIHSASNLSSTRDLSSSNASKMASKCRASCY